VASDECYIDLGWESTPMSILHPDVCRGDHTGLLAVHSLSKRSNMAGYRAGFVSGDPALVASLVAVRRLSNAAEGRERNEIARDSFSYLHFPMVAGIVLLALGLKKTLAHVEDPLKVVPAVALLGGPALYLLAHVAFRWRNVHRFNAQRLLCAIVLLALIPVAVEIPALVTLGIVVVLLAALIAYEAAHFADLRDRLRHGAAPQPVPD
jgi:hypothetical protein